MPKVFVVAEICPLGCGPVILVKSSIHGNVFAWCVGCGLAWPKPQDETWDLGDTGKSEIHASILANGSPIESATKDEMERAALDHLAVSEIIDDKSLCECIGRYNAEYGSDPTIMERAKRVSAELRRLNEREMW